MVGVGQVIIYRLGDADHLQVIAAAFGQLGDLLESEGYVVARAADGRGPQTALTEAILEHWSLAQPQDLIGHVYKSTTQRADIAARLLVQPRSPQRDALNDALTSMRARGLLHFEKEQHTDIRWWITEKG